MLTAVNRPSVGEPYETPSQAAEPESHKRRKYHEHSAEAVHHGKDGRMKLLLCKNWEFTWSDGGDVTKRSYFDGAGRLNQILCNMFAGHESINYERLLFQSDVMSDVPVGAKVRMAVTLEIDSET